MLYEDLLEAIAEELAPLKKITKKCQALGIQIDEQGMVPTQQ